MYTSDFLIVLDALDDLSGVADVFYRINGGSTQTVGVQGYPSITTEGSNNTLEYWSIDNVGNEELPHKISVGVKLDKSNPTGSISINDQRAFTSSVQVKLALTASDVVSGVDQVRCSNDGVWDDEVWEPFSPERNWTLPLGDGVKQVYFQIRDNAGLVSSPLQDSIVLDTVKPVAVAARDQTVETGITVDFDASGSTDKSGIAGFWWDFGDGSSGQGEKVGHVYADSGTYVVILQVTDAAGNVATDSVSITVLAPPFNPSRIIIGVALTIMVIALMVLAARRRKKSLSNLETDAHVA